MQLLQAVTGGQTQIHGRAFCGTVPEDVPDGLEGRTPFQQMHGQRVTKAMWTFERDAQFAVSDQGLKSLRHRGRLQHPDGGSLPQKDPSVWCRWRTAP